LDNKYVNQLNMNKDKLALIASNVVMTTFLLTVITICCCAF